MSNSMEDRRGVAAKDSEKNDFKFYSDDEDSADDAGHDVEINPLVNLQKEALQQQEAASIEKQQLAAEDPAAEAPAEVEETEVLDEAEIERREALERLQNQMIEQQNVVVEHRKKLVLLEKKVAEKKQEEEELGKNFFGVAATISSVGTHNETSTAKEYSVEELEKLRDALKQSLMLQQNKLKFLINSSTTLNKEDHCERVCEAFFETEKTWFAALIQEVDEEAQEVEVAWIGYNIQERLPVSKVTILAENDPEKLFDGAICNAVYPSDGMWYEAVIERKLSDEEAETFAASDLRSAQLRFVVRYKSFGQKMTVPMDYIRVTKEQQGLNQRKLAQLKSKGGAAAGGGPLGVGGSLAAGGKQLTAVTEFQFPEHLRMKASDSDKVKEQKRKKVKALKYSHKVQMQEQGSKIKQNVWQNFQKKGAKATKGRFAIGKHESIFKTPDSVTGKVGVVGSGQAMTTYKTEKTKYSEAFKNMDEMPAAMTKRPRFN